MEFVNKAKKTVNKAGVQAKKATKSAQQAAEKAKQRSLELISDEKLADMIIAALGKQEKVNRILTNKGSKYRIAEVSIEMGVPPAITFSINRE